MVKVTKFHNPLQKSRECYDLRYLSQFRLPQLEHVLNRIHYQRSKYK